jgi:hypothetical protein
MLEVGRFELAHFIFKYKVLLNPTTGGVVTNLNT